MVARTKSWRPVAPVPGAGILFVLRAIGIVLAARWLFSMSQMNFLVALTDMAASPWACVNLTLLFLLVVLPGAKARAERPSHPLPRWLRQTLRVLALLVLLFSVWLIGKFAWDAGLWRTWRAIVQGNGWLVVTPALYAAVVWICRPRALWRTDVAAKHFATGRHAVSLDEATRTVVVWDESRRIGQYDARELTVRWMRGGRFSRIGLLWNSPAAAGHHQYVFSAWLWSAKAHRAAQALEAALRQGQGQGQP